MNLFEEKNKLDNKYTDLLEDVNHGMDDTEKVHMLEQNMAKLK
jgi:hypothetical protein